MRVVVTGATGNVGTSVLRALGGAPEVSEVVGLARRRPEIRLPKTSWVQADVARSDLATIFSGADAVIHLAWLIQPSRDEAVMWQTNVEGSARVLHAAGSAGVGALVYASSVGAYSPGPKDRLVEEDWPTEGIASSAYSRHKAEVERRLDGFEREHPDIRVVRLRPALIFKREAAAEIRRLFGGPLLPTALLRRRFIPVVPQLERLVFQAVHSLDVGEAYKLATLDARASGPYNLAADPVLDAQELGQLLGARPVGVSRRIIRRAADLTWKLRLQPTDPSWLDLALESPLMDTTRARRELGWRARRDADVTLLELLDGMRDGAGYDTPPLDPQAGGPLRLRELMSGLGGRAA
jgi:UDP-glucose 4-epimerase